MYMCMYMYASCGTGGGTGGGTVAWAVARAVAQGICRIVHLRRRRLKLWIASLLAWQSETKRMVFKEHH